MNRIASVSDDDFRTIVDLVPTEFMTEPAKDFAYQSMITSRRELLRSMR